MKNLKKVLALVLAVVMIMGTIAVASAKDYTDVKGTDTYADAIDALSSLKILDGFEDGTFKADGTLNRAQAAKIVAIVHNAATNGKIQSDIAALYANAQNPFVDCNNSWALPYINYCRITGLADGMTATTYAPKRELTGVQWLKLMLTTLNFDTAKEGYTGTGWDINVLNRANEVGLLEGLIFETVKDLQAGQGVDSVGVVLERFGIGILVGLCASDGDDAHDHDDGQDQRKNLLQILHLDFLLFKFYTSERGPLCNLYLHFTAREAGSQEGGGVCNLIVTLGGEVTKAWALRRDSINILYRFPFHAASGIADFIEV